MSVIEDSRKVLQDFIAPELRAIDARLAALEKRLDGMDKRFEGIDKRFDGINKRFAGLNKRFDGFEDRLDGRFGKFEIAMEKRFDQMTSEIRRLTYFHEMELRVARLEGEINKRNLASGDSSSQAA